MNPAEQAARFCSVLFADLGGSLDAHFASTWVVTTSGKVTRWLPASDPAAIASAIRAADTSAGTQAVYVGMGLAPVKGTEHQRPKNTEVGAITGVWVEIDIAGPAHSSGKRLPATREQAFAILAAVGIAPTMVWFSGHGIQAWWGFTEPEVFEPDSERAREIATILRNWRVTFSVHAHRLGRWAIDPVHDLARVLRAPGSTNRKRREIKDADGRVIRTEPLPEVACELISSDGPRYELDDILAATIEQKYLDQFAGMTARTDGKSAKGVDLKAVWRMVTSPAYRAAGYEPPWITLMAREGILTDGDTLLKVFRRGHASGDASSRDASLARCLADVRDDGERVFDERDAVELIMCARLRDGDKLDKVDPARRQDYVIRTVDNLFGESNKAWDERNARRAAAQDALAAQDAPRDATVVQDALAARNPLPLPPAPAEPDTPPGERARIPRDQGAAILRDLAQHSAAVVPDPEGADTDHQLPADPSLPAEDDQDDDDQDDQDDDHDDRGDRDDRGDDQPGPAPEPEPEPAQGEAPEPESPVRPMPSPWGTRTESQDRELTALSESLLGPRAAHFQLWRGQYRGRGAKQERRVVVRVSPDYRWPGQPPEGYVPGTLLVTGWYPAGAFNTLTGWIRALRQDCLVITAPMTAEEFSQRFADTLVRIWEPDTSGGSLANVARDAMESYLRDYPPTAEWNEATAQGVPFIMQGQPRWRVDGRFTVLVRWPSFARHVRTHYAVNVTPAIAAEMAELSGSRVSPTVTQNGQWHTVRREYLGDAAWAAILHAGQLAETQREERHGLHVVGQEPPVRDAYGPTHRSAPGGAV